MVAARLGRDGASSPTVGAIGVAIAHPLAPSVLLWPNDLLGVMFKLLDRLPAPLRARRPPARAISA